MTTISQPNSTSIYDQDAEDHNRLASLDLATPYDTWQVVFLAVIAGCTSLVTIGGNLIVIMSFFLERSIRVPSNYFIASLAVSDLLIGVCSMPLYTTYILSVKVWPLGEVLCDLWLSVDYTACLCSIYTVFCITVDRFCSIKLPAKYRVWRTERKVLTIVCMTWVIPISVFFTSIFGWQYFVGKRTVPDGKCYVQYMEDALFNCLLQVGYFWITLTAMFVLYGGIYQVALDLHRRSEAKRKKQISSLSSMAQKTVGHLGTAVITITRNPKLDASCLAKTRPLSPHVGQAQNWRSENTLEKLPESKGKASDGKKESESDNEKQASLDSDSYTDSSQEEISKSNERKLNKKNIKHNNRRKSLFVGIDIRTLVPKPRQLLDLPPSVVVDDYRPASIAVCGGQSESEDEYQVNPIYSREFERKCSRDLVLSEATSDINLGHSAPYSEFFCPKICYVDPHYDTRNELKTSQPTICSDVKQCQNATSEQIKNRHMKHDAFLSRPSISGYRNVLMREGRRKSSVFTRKRRDTRLNLSLENGLYNRGLDDTDIGFNEEKSTIKYNNPAYLNCNCEENFLPRYDRLEFDHNTREANRVCSEYSQTNIPTIRVPDCLPVKMFNDQYDSSEYRSRFNTYGYKHTLNSLQHPKRRLNEYGMLQNSPIKDLLDWIDNCDRSKPKFINHRSRSTFTCSTIRDTDEDIWVLATKSEQNSNRSSNFSNKSSKEYKESSFSVGDLNTMDKQTRKGSIFSKSRKQSSLSANTLLTPCDDVSVKAMNFNCSPTETEDRTASLPKRKSKSTAWSNARENPSRTACRLNVPRGSNVSETPRHSVISPSSSALAFWNLISRASRFGSADPNETVEQHRLRKQHKKHENRARKALRTITIILGAFVLCWTPWHVLSMIMGFCGDKAHERCVAPVLYDISYWLCYLNSPLNPFCYAFANQQFKKTFLRILRLDWHRV